MRNYTFVAAVVFVLAFIYARGAEDPAEPKGDADGSNREGKFGKIVGYYSVTTLLSLRTITSSALSTCLSTGTNLACRKRKRRGLIKEFDIETASADDTKDLDSSQDDDSSNPQSISDRQGRKVIIWSSTYSTLELIQTALLPGSVVTVSALCNVVNGINIFPSCFIG